MLLSMYKPPLYMFGLIDIRVERCFKADQQLLSNIECFKGIHSYSVSDYMLSCDVSVAGSWQGLC